MSAMHSPGSVRLDGVRFSHASDGDGGFRLALRTLAVAPGERVACIGPSGSGKTTLIELIAGIRLPDAGRVTVGGVEISALGDDARRAWRRERVGMVFQEFELLDYLTGVENVLLPRRLGGSVDAEARSRAAALLERCGVGHAARRLPARLSQGERQRVAVCRALIARPEVLLCDEGTGNLDPRTARETLDVLLGAAEDAGATVFFVTHDHGLLDSFDRVIDLAELRETAEGAAR